MGPLHIQLQCTAQFVTKHNEAFFHIYIYILTKETLPIDQNFPEVNVHLYTVHSIPHTLQF